MQSTPENSALPQHVTFGSRIERVSPEAGTSSSQSKESSPKKDDSLMQWFDKNVEKELEKHEETSSVESFIDPTIKPKSPRNVSPRLLQTSTSGIDIAGKLRTEPDTELSEAVEKLARAEATFHFVGAVRAAEAAAAAVSPEYAEEAAAAGARDFHAEVTDVLRNTTLGEDGNEVIQLVGYMGITRPKTSKR